MIRTLALVAVAFSASPAFAQKGPKLPEGTAEHRGLSYGSAHKERNTLDLFVPKSDKPLPLIVWVHGGAWSAGSKDGGNPAMRFLEQGYAVAAINYRLSQHAVFPAQIADCKEAIRFLRDGAKKYNLNPDKFGAWGSSAGGHLVALLGTSAGAKELHFADSPRKDVSDAVQCVIDFYGPTDLLKIGAQSGAKSKIDHDAATSPESKLVGGAIQQNKEKAEKANPITYVSEASAPFLIVHGDADPLVPHAQSELLHDALKKAGVPVELITLKGAGHGGAGFNAKDVQAKCEAFFEKHLKK